MVQGTNGSEAKVQISKVYDWLCLTGSRNPKENEDLDLSGNIVHIVESRNIVNIFENAYSLLNETNSSLMIF